MSNTQSWNEIKKTLTVGTKLTGVVTKHWPFGIFISIPGIEFTGLVEIINFKDEGTITPSNYPALGSSVDVVVLGFRDREQQISLGMKPSQLNQSRNGEE